jgi:ceramide glucosyltransferase
MLGLCLLAYSVLTRSALAAVIGAFVVKERHLLRTALLFPLRDLLGFVYWMASYGGSEIVWRNQIYRLAKGGIMLPPEGAIDAKHEPVLTA